MFDLEKQISEWRQQMLAAGIRTPVPLEELEIHLREEIDRQLKHGLSEVNAFEISVRRIGRPKILDNEFKKVEITTMKKIGFLATFIGAVIILRILTSIPNAAHSSPNERRGWLIIGGAVLFFGLSNAFFYFESCDSRKVRLWKMIGLAYSTFAILLSAVPISLLLTVPKFGAAVGGGGRILVFTALAIAPLSILGWKKCFGFLPVVPDQRTRTLAGISGCILGIIFIALCFLMGPLHFSIGIVLCSWTLALATILSGVGYGLEKAAQERAMIDP